MRNTGVVPIWVLLIAMLATSVRAEVVADLHSATVPVASQSSQALAAAAKEAMKDVLVKVSGSSTLLSNPVITKALSDARSHVQQYAYSRSKGPDQALSVRFEFDSKYITDLVTEAGAPLWTANRPQVLAWVVVEDEAGRHFVSWDSAPQQAQLVSDEFARRGVPVQLPVFDLVDTAALSTDQVWRLDAEAILAASERYNVQDVVAGRLAAPVGDQTAGDWRYFYQDERINQAVTVPDLQAFLRDGVAMIAANMAARYAIAPTVTDGRGLRMAVTGISDYADYAALVSWLEALELVESATVERVQGDRIELRLQAQASAAQLASIFELNNRLLPLPGAVPLSPAPSSAPVPVATQPLESSPTPGSTPLPGSTPVSGAAPVPAPAPAQDVGIQLNYQWRS